MVSGVRMLVSTLLSLFPLAAPSALASDQERATVLILHQSRPIYEQAVQALCAALNAQHVAHQVAGVADDEDHARKDVQQRLADSKPAVVVVTGAPLVEAALAAKSGARIVHLMVPNAADASFAADRSNRVCGIACDVAPQTLVDWVRRTAPQARRVAVPHGSATARTVQALVAEGRRQGLEVVPLDVDRDRFADATSKLDEARFDGALMIPDSTVYNSQNVEHLLLWGLRRKKPVWGFSGKIVRAGAFASVHVEPDEIGRETADLVRAILADANAAREALAYPTHYGRAVNTRTAELIGIPLDTTKLGDNVTRFGD